MEDILQNNNIKTTPDPVSHFTSTGTVDEFQNTQLSPEDLDSRWLRWKCINCGYVYEGMKELKKCPRCGNENPDLFEDAD